MELMGVRFYLLDDQHAGRELAGFPALADRWRPILQRDGISLYEYSGAMPRAFIVEQVELEANPEQVIARMRDADLRALAFVEESYPEMPSGPPGAPDASARRAEIVQYEPNRVVIETTAPANGMLVLTDQYDAGWRATVDGSEVRVMRTDFLFRGVPIAGGNHRVVLTYRPTSFIAGAFGTLAGTVLAAALAFTGTTKRRWQI
jgi:hypothetical protein